MLSLSIRSRRSQARGVPSASGRKLASRSGPGSNSATEKVNWKGSFDFRTQIRVQLIKAIESVSRNPARANALLPDQEANPETARRATLVRTPNQPIDLTRLPRCAVRI